MDEIPDICKNCKRSKEIDVRDENGILRKLNLCKYKDISMKELIKVADGDVSLKLHCSFKEEY